MKCKHLNASITEYAEEAVTHFFRDGQPDGQAAETASMLNYVDVICPDCGLDRRYSRRKMPKWISECIQASLAKTCDDWMANK